MIVSSRFLPFQSNKPNNLVHAIRASYRSRVLPLQVEMTLKSKTRTTGDKLGAGSRSPLVSSIQGSIQGASRIQNCISSGIKDEISNFDV